MKYRLVAPDGTRIEGTREKLFGSNGIDNDDEAEITQNSDGTFNFDYDQNGTEVDWDSQETVTNAEGHRIFYDEDDADWPENELKLEPVLDEAWYEEQAEQLTDAP